MNQTEVKELVKEKVAVGRNTTLSVLNQLVQENMLFTQDGPGRAMRYFRANGETSRTPDGD